MSAPESVPVVVTSSAPTSRLATPPVVLAPRQSQPWSSSIFACYEDIGNCCWTMCCPAALFGAMANALDNRAGGSQQASCWAYIVRQLCCASVTLSSKSRARIREKYNLVESPCSDFATHCFFSPCALCQEYRELKRFFPDLGGGRKGTSSNSKKKSLRHQLLYKSVTRALNESTVAEDGSIVWLTTHPGGRPVVQPPPAAPSSSAGLRPSTS